MKYSFTVFLFKIYLSETKNKMSTLKKKSRSPSLAPKTQLILRKLLFKLAKCEQELELQRQFLASNENMEPYSVFQRVDRAEDGFVTSMELVSFLRDNGVTKATEADCYYLVKFFDSDEDGRLSYPDFMQMILPCVNEELRAKATQRPNMAIKKGDYLTLDVEREMTKLLQGEITLHRRTENLKQQLEAAADFNVEALYASIDDWGYGFVDAKNLKGFFRNNKVVVQDADCDAIIRRMDMDGDLKLTKEEFV